MAHSRAIDVLDDTSLYASIELKWYMNPMMKDTPLDSPFMTLAEYSPPPDPTHGSDLCFKWCGCCPGIASCPLERDLGRSGDFLLQHAACT
jgi:hypothetical protein